MAVHWVLRRENFFLNSVGDVSLLPAVLRAAAAFDRQAAIPDDDAMQSMSNSMGLASIFGL